MLPEGETGGKRHLCIIATSYADCCNALVTVATLYNDKQADTNQENNIQSFERGRKGLHCVTKRVGVFTSYAVRAAIRAVD